MQRIVFDSSSFTRAPWIDPSLRIAFIIEARAFAHNSAALPMNSKNNIFGVDAGVIIIINQYILLVLIYSLSTIPLAC